MKILLVDPPYERLQNVKTTPNYPLGLAYISAFLNKKGHQTIYLNLDWDPRLPAANPFSYRDLMNRYNLFLKETATDSRHPIWRDFENVLKLYKPNMVGISTSTIKVKSAFRLLEIIKRVDERIVTVLGGHHAQVFAKEILENVKELDFVILGEGEQTILELVNALERSPQADLHVIEGLVHKDNNCTVFFNSRRPLIDDLNTLPFPDHCYYYSGAKFVRIPIMAVMASRGCPYSCNYCSTNNIWQRRVRMRSPRTFVEEIKVSIKNQKERFLSFYDDCFTLNKKWLLEFCDIMIKEKVQINWQCITGVNLLEEAVFRKIVQAGCRKINLGIESGSERILKLANKNIDLDTVRSIFRLAKKYNISTAAYIMIGFPTETEYDIRLTQRIIKEIHPNWVYCNVLIPLPGTPFYDLCLGLKLLDSAKAWRGDTVKNIVMNFTNVMSDDEFLRLVDETFTICYRINRNIVNLIKRTPLKQYMVTPSLIFSDLKRTVQYIRDRNA